MIFIVGKCKECFTTDTLPSNQDVLCRFINIHITEGFCISISANVVAEELISIWHKFGIPHQQKRNIVREIKTLYESYQQIKKNMIRNSEIEIDKRKHFLKNAWDLFDIVNNPELEKLNNPAKLELLEHQRKIHKYDFHLLRSVESKYNALSLADAQPSTNTLQPIDVVNEAIISDISSLSLSTSSASDYQPPVTKKSKENISPKPSSSKINLIDNNVAAAFDRTKISNRGAALVMATIANSMGHDINKVAISKDTVRRNRQTARVKISEEIFASFTPDPILTVHWDGKLLEDLSDMKIVDRLCVIISGNGNTKLLGVPKINNGTGAQQAEMVFKMLVDWQVTDNIKAICFDTTASNTGKNNGACKLIEEHLERKLLWFACRHHIYELIAAAVFTALLKDISSGPDIQLFKRFQKDWNTFNVKQIKSGLCDTVVQNVFDSAEKSSSTSFIYTQLDRISSGRDDYKEFLHLALLFLGEPLTVEIRKPGAISRARWMAKIIYSLKIYLFRDQFTLKSMELKGLRDFNIFVVKVYLPKWFTCMNPTTAPTNDLLLLKELIAYKNINSTASNAAFKSFSNHLWYLSETLVALSFFDRNLDSETKIAMVNKLESNNITSAFNKAKLPQNLNDGTRLEDFVTKNTKQFFEISFGQMPDFFRMHPDNWRNDTEYLRLENIVSHFLVVNDVAERGIGLIKNYNAILTHQEEYKQCCLQVVEDHYKRIPVVTKKNMVAALQNKN